MPEARYPDYNLFPAVFQDWLRHAFDDVSITVEVRPTAHKHEPNVYTGLKKLDCSQSMANMFLTFPKAGF